MFRSLYRIAKALRPAPELQTPWAGVPEPFRNLPIGTLHVPDDLAQWQHERLVVKKTVLECLGEIPPRPDPIAVRTAWKKRADGYTVEKFFLDNGVDAEVPGFLAIPDKRLQPVPAVLTMHGHGGCKEELFGMVPSHHDVAGR